MKKHILSLALLFITVLMINISPVFGQVQMDPGLKPAFAPGYTSTENKAAPVTSVLQTLAGSLIYVAGPLAVLMIAIGGFQYVASHGDSTQMENAKKTIMFAIIGLIVIILSWAIVTNIATVFLSTGSVGTGSPDKPA
jgi:amino acid transporter